MAQFLTQDEAHAMIQKAYGNNAIALGNDNRVVYWAFKDEPVYIYHVHIYKEV